MLPPGHACRPRSCGTRTLCLRAAPTCTHSLTSGIVRGRWPHAPACCLPRRLFSLVPDRRCVVLPQPAASFRVLHASFLADFIFGAGSACTEDGIDPPAEPYGSALHLVEPKLSHTAWYLRGTQGFRHRWLPVETYLVRRTFHHDPCTQNRRVPKARLCLG